MYTMENEFTSGEYLLLHPNPYKSRHYVQILQPSILVSAETAASKTSLVYSFAGPSNAKTRTMFL
jgi:hypothetical protein